MDLTIINILRYFILSKTHIFRPRILLIGLYWGGTVFGFALFYLDSARIV